MDSSFRVYEVTFRPSERGGKGVHAAYSYSYSTVLANSKAEAKRIVKNNYPWAVITTVKGKGRESGRIKPKQIINKPMPRITPTRRIR